MDQYGDGLPMFTTAGRIPQVLQQGQGPPPVRGPPPQGPPPQGPPPQHHAYSHHAMTAVIGNHSGYPPGPSTYAQPPEYALARPMRPDGRPKKETRAIQACEPCRQHKRKCDEGNPCLSCRENHFSCVYGPSGPEKIDKNIKKVMSQTEQLHKDSQSWQLTIVDKLNSLDKRIKQMEPHQIRPISPSLGELPEPERPTLRLRRDLDDHRTAPQNLLLLWPSVRSLLDEANADVDENYVQEAEDRGILRLCGYGEGGEFGDGAVEIDGTQSGGPAGPAPSEDSFSDTSALPEDTWGYGIKAYAKPDAGPLSRFPSVGGLKTDGSLDLDGPTVDSLWASFVRHMYIVHPIIDIDATRATIDDFVSRYSPKNLRTQSDVTLFAGEHGTAASKKRHGGSQAPRRDVAMAHSLDTERSPTNAIIYLVLALGKICAHEWSSPGDSPSAQPANNMKLVPGLAYYAKAAEIMGDHSDGNELIHAQMFLLAGLYKGQLARVKESMHWIVKASAAAMNLLERYKLYGERYWTEYAPLHDRNKKGQKPVTDRDSNLIALVSWSCLQLESDILAELRSPSSGILNLSDFLPMPRGLTGGETYEKLARSGGWNGVEYDKIIMFYVARVFLRKRLNDVQRQLYGPGCLDKSVIQVQKALHKHESILDGWRALLPAGLKWTNDDDLPTGILCARLRADYWRARYLISRPYLDYAIHIMQDVKDGGRVEEVALDAYRNPRDRAEIHIFKAIDFMGEGTVRAACQSCVEAAMLGTVALDGVQDHMVMTNIHGIAHAQFGNMLVLSAVWRTHRLRKLIDQDRFRALLERTISFLYKLSAISPTCQRDCQILGKIRRVLFGGPPDQKLESN